MIEFLSYQTVPSTKRGCSGQVETRVEQAVRTCTNVKNRQTRSKDNAVDVVMKIIEKENLLENKILAIRLDPKYATDKNLTGLIANGLLETFHRPVLILNQVIEKNEVQHAILTGIALDKLAEQKQIPFEELQSMLSNDEPLYGIDEVIAYGICNLYGSIALTNFGYIDKEKISCKNCSFIAFVPISPRCLPPARSYHP